MSSTPVHEHSRGGSNAPAGGGFRWDVVIVGGGPAGLSAALMLARACRNVLVVDAGQQRNLASSHVHGLLGHDGVAPQDLLSKSRAQLLQYGNARFLQENVTACEKVSDGFELVVNAGENLRTRVVLFAQGVSDVLPGIEGIEEFYGSAVHHCPFCDAWEHRGGSFVVCGEPIDAAEMAWELRGWSDDVVLVTPDLKRLSNDTRDLLKQAEVKIVSGEISRFTRGNLKSYKLTLADGRELALDALFFATQVQKPLQLLEALGCTFKEECPVLSGSMETSVPGVFVAGNCAEGHDMVFMAAAQGAEAAIAIQEFLLKQGHFFRRKD